MLFVVSAVFEVNRPIPASPVPGGILILIVVHRARRRAFSCAGLTHTKRLACARAIQRKGSGKKRIT